MGFELFHGFFFCKPQMVVRREVPAFKLNYLRFVPKSCAPSSTLISRSASIKQEVSRSVRLLPVLNSAAYGYNGRCDVGEGGDHTLGERQMRKWATMIALSEIGEDSWKAGHSSASEPSSSPSSEETGS